MTDPLIGSLLDGRYRIDARAARGGMATVYRALDLRLERVVAVKVMHPALADDAEFVARFIREARSAARLSHPCVVSVYDQGTDGGSVFLVMEFVEGETLRDRLRAQGPLPVEEAVPIAEAVLSALDAAHRAGLVHRDVKPENVLLADDGRVLVADFGLARAVEASTLTATTGLLLGTVAYIAPEQLASSAASTRTDVYAAGIVLLEMLTGSTPYAGETALSIVYRHAHDDIPPPSASVPVPTELDDLVVRATRRNPDERPADAGAFLAELRRVRRTLALPPAPTDPGLPRRTAHTLVVQQPTTVTPAAAPARPKAPPRQRRRVRRGYVALAVILALALLAGVAGWWYGSGRYTDTPRLVGLTEAQARSEAQEGGFGLDVRRAFSDDVPVGRIADTDPDPGDRIVQGDRITVFVSRGPDLRAIPSVTGLTPTEAGQRLREAGLGVTSRIDRAYSDTVPEGRVVGTEPATGTKLRRDTAVTLVVSRGVQPVAVPSVVGDRRADAEKRLGSLGFKVTVTETFSETVEKGRVVAQTPAKGTHPKGSTVALTVSKGPQLFAVPDLRGMTRQQAQRTLERAGFEGRAFDVPDGGGRVIAQSPKAGAMERRGTTVNYYVF